MDEWRLLQNEAFEALRTYGNAPCFLRVSLTNDALWVCDLPRRSADPSGAQKALETLGVVCRMDAHARLWRLDASQERYAAWNAALPKDVPALPEDDRLHEAYALCRLLLLHPSPIECQPMDWNRAALKQSTATALDMERFVAPAHAACAGLLRSNAPLPSMAGGVLAQWLVRQPSNARCGG